MGGIGALLGAFTHEPGLLETGLRGVQEPVGTVALSDALAEVGQIEQELQQAHGGELGGREARPPSSRVPVSKIVVIPQSVEAVTYPYRRRTGRVARPRELRGQRRDLFTRTGAEGRRARLQRHRSSKQPEHAC